MQVFTSDVGALMVVVMVVFTSAAGITPSGMVCMGGGYWRVGGIQLNLPEILYSIYVLCYWIPLV